MLFYLFLLFSIVPLVELTILFRIGYATEWWVPILLVIFTGIAGAVLARWQGLQVLQRIQDDLRANRMPTDALVDGFLILLAGILLVTPGVITDVAGCALLIPPVRAIFKRGVLGWARRNIEVRVSGMQEGFRQSADAPRSNRRDEIVDAKVINTRVEDAR